MQIKSQEKRHLTLYEREKIEYYLKLFMTIKTIAQRIKKDRSVVFREIKRNSEPNGEYIAIKAQEKFETRKNRRKGRKLEKDQDLHYYVTTKLKNGWSPHVIAGTLKEQPQMILKDFPKLKGKKISHESIFDYIYNGNGKFERLYEFLPYKKNKRKKQKGRKYRTKVVIPNRISIHERPSEIEQRSTPSHWESDLMIFSKQKQCLSVQTERMFKIVSVHKVQNKTALENETAIRKTIDKYPLSMFKTITFDNGKENVTHTKIRNDYDIGTYFCDSYCSWQKGSVENQNKILRRFFPKKTNLSAMPDEEIKKVEDLLNSIPRKSLNYLSPLQAFTQYFN